MEPSAAAKTALEAAYKAADGGKVFISSGKFQSAPKKGTVPAVYTTLKQYSTNDYIVVAE